MHLRLQLRQSAEFKRLFYLNRAHEALALAASKASWLCWYLLQVAVILGSCFSVSLFAFGLLYSSTVPEASFSSSLSFEPAASLLSARSLELLGSQPSSGIGSLNDVLHQRREDQQRCLTAKKEFASLVAVEEQQERQQKADRGAVVEEGLVFKVPASTLAPSIGQEHGGLFLLAGFPPGHAERRRNLSPAAAALEAQVQVLCAPFLAEANGSGGREARTRLTLADFSAVAVADVLQGEAGKDKAKNKEKGGNEDEDDWISGAFGERAGQRREPSEALSRSRRASAPSWIWGSPAAATPAEVYAELTAAIRREGLLEPGQEYEGKIAVRLSEDSLLAWALMAGAYRSGRRGEGGDEFDDYDDDGDYPLPPASFFLTVDLLAVNPDAVEEAATAAAAAVAAASASTSTSASNQRRKSDETIEVAVNVDGTTASASSFSSPAKTASAEAGAERRVWTNPEVGLSLGAHNVLARCRKRLIVPTRRGSVTRVWDVVKRKASSAFSFFVLGPIRVATFLPRLAARMGFGAISATLNLVGLGGSKAEEDVDENEAFRTIELPLSCFGGFVESSKHRTRGIKVTLEPAWFPQEGIPTSGSLNDGDDDHYYRHESSERAPYHYFYEEGDVLFPSDAPLGGGGGRGRGRRGGRGLMSRLGRGLTAPLRWLADAIAPPPFPAARRGHFLQRRFVSFPPSGSSRGSPQEPSSSSRGAGDALLLHNLPLNAAEAALSARVQFYTRMRGLAHPLYHWFWTSLFVIVAALTMFFSACTLGCAALGRAAFTGDIGVGVPFPQSLGRAIQSSLMPSQERLDREKRAKAAIDAAEASPPVARRDDRRQQQRQAEGDNDDAASEAEIVSRAQEAVAAAMRYASVSSSPQRNARSAPHQQQQQQMWPFGQQGEQGEESSSDNDVAAMRFARGVTRETAKGLVRPAVAQAQVQAQEEQRPEPVIAQQEVRTAADDAAAVVSSDNFAAAVGTAQTTPTHQTAGSDGTVSDTLTY